MAMFVIRGHHSYLLSLPIEPLSSVKGDSPLDQGRVPELQLSWTGHSSDGDKEMVYHSPPLLCPAGKKGSQQDGEGWLEAWFISMLFWGRVGDES